MFRVTKANFTRTLLLSMINEESMQYIKIKSKSKINGKNANEIISTFGSYEIQIDNPLIVGTPRRSGRVRTKKKMNSIEKKEEEDTEFEYETPSDINNYVSGLKRRKVLFSKNKLKHAMKANNAITSIANMSKATSKEFLDSSDTNNSMSVNQIKKGMMILRKISYKLKKRKNKYT